MNVCGQKCFGGFLKVTVCTFENTTHSQAIVLFMLMDDSHTHWGHLKVHLLIQE